jgi:hypothetical protein
MLYSNLKAQSDPYEELESAAHLFPMEDDEVQQPTSIVPSISSNFSSSPSPPFDKTDDDSDSESDSSDWDSDVEPLDLDNDEGDASQPDSVM